MFTFSIKAMFPGFLKSDCVSSQKNTFHLTSHAFYHGQACVILPYSPCCFGKLLKKNYDYQTTDGSFSFSISPDHKAVSPAALRRDLHRAVFLIASLQGGSS